MMGTPPDPATPAIVTAFQSIAAAIDEVGEERAAALLAKLALLLCHEVGDADRIASCIERAKLNV